MTSSPTYKYNIEAKEEFSVNMELNNSMRIPSNSTQINNNISNFKYRISSPMKTNHIRKFSQIEINKPEKYILNKKIITQNYSPDSKKPENVFITHPARKTSCAVNNQKRKLSDSIGKGQLPIISKNIKNSSIKSSIQVSNHPSPSNLNKYPINARMSPLKTAINVCSTKLVMPNIPIPLCPKTKGKLKQKFVKE